MIRRMAFKKSENEYGHWLPLILADRVDVVEGIIEDFTKGRFPNIFVEKGYKAEWKYDKLGLLAKFAVVAAVTTAAVVLLTRNNEDD